MGTLAPVLAAVLALACFSPQARAAEETPQSLQKKCDAKDWSACASLGNRYLLGEGGVDLDNSKAAALFERACNANYGDACVSLAFMYDGSTRPLDKGKEKQLFTKACELKVASGCHHLGKAILEGDGDKSLERGLKLLNQACDMKEGEACFDLFSLYNDGKQVVKDKARSDAYYERACDLNSISCILIFNMTLQPNREACDEGKAWNCFVVGSAHLQGEAYLTPDEKEAAPYLLKACDGGEFAACGVLGWIYDGGKQTKRDVAKAAGYYQKGCAGEDPYSCQQIGTLYVLGQGVPEDPRRAAGYLQTACEANKPDVAFACYVLGKGYAEGSGVKKDPARAAILYAQACRLGDQEACLAAKSAPPAGPRAKPVVATTAAETSDELPASLKGAIAGCPVGGLHIGNVTAADVQYEIKRRGGIASNGTNNGKPTLNAMSGDFSDVGAAVTSVNYTLDGAGASAKVIEVTIVNHANSNDEYAKLLAARKAATDAKAKNPKCSVRLVPNADTWFIYEFYQLKK